MNRSESPNASDAPVIDVWERTKPHSGSVQAMNRRLFMQLLVFDCEPATGCAAVVSQLEKQLQKAKAPFVLYEDLNHPLGLGLLTWSEDPNDFITRVRPCWTAEVAPKLRLRPDFTMFGRTYATGYEPDLKYWLLDRPVETVTNSSWPWAVWYPLRRSGAFARLEPREQGSILREHAEIGKAYGAQDLAHDVRLMSHGLDARDNEFVIGLVGKELHPLSHVVQAMRSTRQTAEFIVQMGPFFVGRAIAG